MDLYWGQRINSYHLLSQSGQVLNSVSVLNSLGLTPTSDGRSETKGCIVGIGELKEKVYQVYQNTQFFKNTRKKACEKREKDLSVWSDGLGFTRMNPRI